MATKIAKNSTTGAFITVSKSNSSRGYVTLVEDSFNFSNGSLFNNKRTMLVHGDIKMLDMFVKSATNQELPGKIVYNEILASDLMNPTTDYHFKLAKRLNPEQSFQDAIQFNIKKIAANGPAFTVNGDVICRFAEYTTNAEATDIRIEHDNQAELDAYRSAVKAESVKLPA